MASEKNRRGYALCLKLWFLVDTLNARRWVRLAPGNVFGTSTAANWASCAGKTDDCWSTGRITFGLRLLTDKDIKLSLGFYGADKYHDHYCEMEFSNSSCSHSRSGLLVCWQGLVCPHVCMLGWLLTHCGPHAHTGDALLARDLFLPLALKAPKSCGVVFEAHFSAQGNTF
jgi:hypothetical protein